MHVSVVQTSLSLQSFSGPGTQTPSRQVSFSVHMLPSSHVWPFLLVSATQVATPPTSAHVRHCPHVFTGPGMQVPPWHVSPRVQTSPSLHGVPFATFEHVPVLGLQT
jgi:hypothetical protein